MSTASNSNTMIPITNTSSNSNTGKSLVKAERRRSATSRIKFTILQKRASSKPITNTSEAESSSSDSENQGYSSRSRSRASSYASSPILLKKSPFVTQEVLEDNVFCGIEIAPSRTESATESSTENLATDLEEREDAACTTSSSKDSSETGECRQEQEETVASESLATATANSSAGQKQLQLLQPSSRNRYFCSNFSCQGDNQAALVADESSYQTAQSPSPSPFLQKQNKDGDLHAQSQQESDDTYTSFQTLRSTTASGSSSDDDEDSSTGLSTPQASYITPYTPRQVNHHEFMMPSIAFLSSTEEDTTAFMNEDEFHEARQVIMESALRGVHDDPKVIEELSSFLSFTEELMPHGMDQEQTSIQHKYDYHYHTQNNVNSNTQQQTAMTVVAAAAAWECFKDAAGGFQVGYGIPMADSDVWSDDDDDDDDDDDVDDDASDLTGPRLQQELSSGEHAAKSACTKPTTSIPTPASQQQLPGNASLPPTYSMEEDALMLPQQLRFCNVVADAVIAASDEDEGEDDDDDSIEQYADFAQTFEEHIAEEFVKAFTVLRRSSNSTDKRDDGATAVHENNNNNNNDDDAGYITPVASLEEGESSASCCSSENDTDDDDDDDDEKNDAEESTFFTTDESNFAYAADNENSDESTFMQSSGGTEKFSDASTLLNSQRDISSDKMSDEQSTLFNFGSKESDKSPAKDETESPAKDETEVLAVSSEKEDESAIFAFDSTDSGIAIKSEEATSPISSELDKELVNEEDTKDISCAAPTEIPEETKANSTFEVASITKQSTEAKKERHCFSFYDPALLLETEEKMNSAPLQQHCKMTEETHGEEAFESIDKTTAASAYPETSTLSIASEAKEYYKVIKGPKGVKYSFYVPEDDSDLEEKVKRRNIFSFYVPDHLKSSEQVQILEAGVSIDQSEQKFQMLEEMQDSLFDSASWRSLSSDREATETVVVDTRTAPVDEIRNALIDGSHDLNIETAPVTVRWSCPVPKSPAYVLRKSGQSYMLEPAPASDIILNPQEGPEAVLTDPQEGPKVVSTDPQEGPEVVSTDPQEGPEAVLMISQEQTEAVLTASQEQTDDVLTVPQEKTEAREETEAVLTQTYQDLETPLHSNCRKSFSMLNTSGSMSLQPSISEDEELDHSSSNGEVQNAEFSDEMHLNHSGSPADDVLEVDNRPLLNCSEPTIGVALLLENETNIVEKQETDDITKADCILKNEFDNQDAVQNIVSTEANIKEDKIVPVDDGSKKSKNSGRTSSQISASVEQVLTSLFSDPSFDTENLPDALHTDNGSKYADEIISKAERVIYALFDSSSLSEEDDDEKYGEYQASFSNDITEESSCGSTSSDSGRFAERALYFATPKTNRVTGPRPAKEVSVSVNEVLNELLAGSTTDESVVSASSSQVDHTKTAEEPFLNEMTNHFFDLFDVSSSSTDENEETKDESSYSELMTETGSYDSDKDDATLNSLVTIDLSKISSKDVSANLLPEYISGPSKQPVSTAEAAKSVLKQSGSSFPSESQDDDEAKRASMPVSSQEVRIQPHSANCTAIVPFIPQYESHQTYFTYHVTIPTPLPLPMKQEQMQSSEFGVNALVKWQPNLFPLDLNMNKLLPLVESLLSSIDASQKSLLSTKQQYHDVSVSSVLDSYAQRTDDQLSLIEYLQESMEDVQQVHIEPDNRAFHSSITSRSLSLLYAISEEEEEDVKEEERDNEGDGAATNETPRPKDRSLWSLSDIEASLEVSLGTFMNDLLSPNKKVGSSTVVEDAALEQLLSSEYCEDIATHMSKQNEETLQCTELHLDLSASVEDDNSSANSSLGSSLHLKTAALLSDGDSTTLLNDEDYDDSLMDEPLDTPRGEGSMDFIYGATLGTAGFLGDDEIFRLNDPHVALPELFAKGHFGSVHDMVEEVHILKAIQMERKIEQEMVDYRDDISCCDSADMLERDTYDADDEERFSEILRAQSYQIEQQRDRIESLKAELEEEIASISNDIHKMKLDMESEDRSVDPEGRHSDELNNSDLEDAFSQEGIEIELGDLDTAITQATNTEGASWLEESPLELEDIEDFEFDFIARYRRQLHQVPVEKSIQEVNEDEDEDEDSDGLDDEERTLDDIQEELRKELCAAEEDIVMPSITHSGSTTDGALIFPEARDDESTGYQIVELDKKKNNFNPLDSIICGEGLLLLQHGEEARQQQRKVVTFSNKTEEIYYLDSFVDDEISLTSCKEEEMQTSSSFCEIDDLTTVFHDMVAELSYKFGWNDIAPNGHVDESPLARSSSASAGTTSTSSTLVSV